MKNKKKLGLYFIVFTLAVVAAVYFSISRTTNTRLFCVGKNPKTHEVLTVYYTPPQNNKSVVSIYGQPDENAQETLSFQDQQGSADGPKPLRVSLKIDAHKTLQVVRECSETPVCRLEEVNHMTSEELKTTENKLIETEKIAFETRKQASLMAEKYSALRKQLAEKKKKKSAKELKQLNEETNFVVAELHNLSARAQDLQRPIQKLREQVQSKGVNAELTNLEILRVNDWCPDLR